MTELDEWAAVEAELAAPSAPVASGGDEWAAVEAELGGSTLEEELAESKPTISDRLRPIARGGLKGLTSLFSTPAELALSAVRYFPGVDPRPNPNIPYDFGDVNEAMQSDLKKYILDPYLPRHEGDSRGLEVASEFATPGLGMFGVAQKASKLGKGPKFLRAMAKRPKTEVASIFAGAGAAGAAEEVLPDMPLAPVAANLLAALSVTNIASLPGRGKQAVTAVKGAKEVAKKTKAAGGRMYDSIDLEPVARRQAQANIQRALGEEGIERLSAKLDDLPAPQGTGKYTSLGERTKENRLLGLGAHLDDTSDVARTRADRMAKRRAVHRTKKLESVAPKIDDAAAEAKTGLNKAARKSRENIDELYRAIDPEGTSSIATVKERNQYAKFLRQEAPTGVRGKAAVIVKQYLNGTAKTGKKIPPTMKQKHNFLHDLRRRAGEVQRADPGSTDSLLMGELRDSIDESLERAATHNKGFSPAQSKAYKKATAAARLDAETFGTGLPKAFKKKNAAASTYAKKILSPATPQEELTRLSKVIPADDLPVWRRAIVDEIKEQATDLKYGEVKQVKLGALTRRAARKAPKLFTPDHRRNMNKLYRDIWGENKATRMGQRHKQGVGEKSKSLFGEMKDMMASRLGWKYPIHRKVIQLGDKSGKMRRIALNDMIDDVLIDFIWDEKFAKEMVDEIKNAKPADYKNILSTGKGKKILDTALVRTKAILKTSTGYVGTAFAKKTPGVAGYLGAEAAPEGETNEEIDIFSDLGEALTDPSGPFLGISEAHAEAPKKKVKSSIPINWEPYTKALGDRESSNNYKAVNNIGFVGKYQFGLPALVDAGLVKRAYAKEKNGKLNDPKVWNKGLTLQKFLASPEIQEEAMRKYTKQNFGVLKRIGVITNASTPEEIAGALAASHLKGPGGARELIMGKKDNKDAYGTKASEYLKLGQQSQKKTT